MQNVELFDEEGNKVRAKILFMHYDLDFQKKYVIYSIDDDVMASAYEMKGEQCILNNDLTSAEYDMLDAYLIRKLGANYA